MTMAQEEAVWNAAIRAAAREAERKGSYEIAMAIRGLERSLTTATNRTY